MGMGGYLLLVLSSVISGIGILMLSLLLLVSCLFILMSSNVFLLLLF